MLLGPLGHALPEDHEEWSSAKLKFTNSSEANQTSASNTATPRN